MTAVMQEGAEIPSLEKRPRELDLFLFSAATWNAHRIHFDQEYARREGHPGLVVHGSLQANWLVELVVSWLGPASQVHRVQYRNVASAYVGGVYHVRGRVTSVRMGERPELTCEVWVEGAKGTTTSGVVIASV